MEEKRVYELEIQESITGKQRTRMNTNTGRAYIPTKTKNYEYLVRQLFVYKYPQFVPIEGRVKMTITAYYELPKKKSKVQEAEKITNKNNQLEEEIIEKDKGIEFLNGRIDGMEYVIEHLNLNWEDKQL